MPSKKEIEEVLKLDAEKRFSYTIKRIADFEFVWAIGDQHGFANYGDDNGNVAFAIWPFEAYAALCCKADFANCKPEAIELDFFQEEYLTDFKDRKMRLAIFPLPTDKGILIDIEEFEQRLQKELDEYY
ncbi:MULTISPECIES: DUF2750 domain-containing protein [Niastella]|uniref:DUF2750 domain-containing protein n=1 Tax=Niastella soli TaxID=2821487 RepID=A0ABS3YXY7_9BACT|nr:DUF2750 domain-containing protein [Niastella soli]MBO9202786.1 DUF2750 domain-containing protein [Niastella soli]